MEQLTPRNIHLATHPYKQANILNSDRNFEDSNPFVSILVQGASRFNIKIKKMQNMVIIHHVPFPKTSSSYILEIIVKK